ncbi:MAG: penicillin acylase family protein [Acidobacteriia bacterium]|nr:penicillin acylase family protein [Terriglobia bacterium]
MKRALKRVLLSLLLLVVLVAAGAGIWVYHRCRASLPQLDGKLRVAGLSAPVEVRRDARGVPHLRAQSLEDLFFAQGYVTAQDRLWQMDLVRRLAEGDLSEIFGERTLRIDIENRTLGFRQAAERALAEMDPDSARMLSAYARGVNAFIATHDKQLPIEFALLGYHPRPWGAVDSFGVALNMAKVLSTTWPIDLMREHIRAKIPADLYADLFPDHSAYDHPVAELPPAPAPGKSKPGNESSLDLIPLDPVLESLSEPEEYSWAGLGSNNWVVSGAHTETGKPLLANDPHLGHSIPSVWYMIHLKAPGLDVSGVSLPGLPLVIIGHNARIAWGMTNTGPDVQDLYVESFNFRDPSKYLHNAGWVPAEVREEPIRVSKESDYHLLVKVTRHGPVISHDGDRDLALRWTALEPHALTFPFLKIDQAGNWQEFTNALRGFSGPMQNFVYADVDGNIGYYAAGWVPMRKQGDGTVPVQGSTDDFDWMGYIPFEDLPHAYNPASGIVATANGRVVPDAYPYLITRRWEAPYRTARIFQLLESGSRFTVADMLRVQMDIYAMEDVWLAKRLVGAGANHPASTPDAQYALNVLKSWDGEAHADSAATLVCEVTRPALLARLLRPKLAEDLSGYHWAMSSIFLEKVFDNSLTRWLPPGDADFDATLIKSLEDGVARIPGLVHSRSHEAWKWGDTIPLTFHHPLSGGIPIFGRYLNVGPFPQRGMLTTVKATTPAAGPSMRMIVDFSNLENSVQNLTLGESGQILSAYYKDQFEAWYNGQSFPMLFGDAAVEQGTVHKLVLEPAEK